MQAVDGRRLSAAGPRSAGLELATAISSAGQTKDVYRAVVVCSKKQVDDLASALRRGGKNYEVTVLPEPIDDDTITSALVQSATR